MKQKGLTRLIMALCLIAAMIAILLAAGVMIWFSVKPEPLLDATPAATARPDVTDAEDLLPDRSRLLLRHEGTLTDAAGRSIALSDMAGEQVVILFWSSWCGDCKEYFAGAFDEAARAADAAGARLILAAREGVRGETRATAEACLRDYGIRRETLMDPDAQLFAALGLRSVPSMAFIHADGTLMHTTAAMPNGAEMSAMLEYAAGGAQDQTEQLIAALTEEGGVASAVMVENARLTPRKTVLSETQGLMLHYALQAERQPLFDSMLAWVRTRMSRSGLTAWQTVNGQMAGVNASLDDLRIVHALLLADEKWGGYADELGYRERALYNTCVRDGYLRDFADLATGQCSADVTLCYQDVVAMEALAGYRAAWQDAADNARGLLEGGVISEAFPLYWPRYDAAGGAFTGDVLQMNEAMVTVLHAVRAGVAKESTLCWLEDRLNDGYLAAGYTTDGSIAPGREFESTATYALLVQIGLEAGRPDMVRMAVREMERMRAFTPPLVGGYGGDGMLLFTFDAVQALLAWQSLNASCVE